MEVIKIDGGFTDMTNKIKVLIGDDSADYGAMYANNLRAMWFFVLVRPKDGLQIFDAIKNEMPDVVIIDAIMPHLDAIELMKKIINKWIHEKNEYMNQ